MVSDRNVAKRWYSEVLGLDLTADDEHWVCVGHRGRGGEIHLCQVSEAGEGAHLEPGNTGLLLRVEGDLHRFCEDFKARGGTLVQPPLDRGWGLYAVVRDPDGNELFLMPAS